VARLEASAIFFFFSFACSEQHGLLSFQTRSFQKGRMCVCFVSRFECYLVLQRAEAAHDAQPPAPRAEARAKPPPPPPLAFLGGPKERAHRHAGAGGAEAEAPNSAPGLLGGPAGGGGPALLLGACGFWNPLVGLKVLQKLTDALAAAEAADLQASLYGHPIAPARRASKEPWSSKEPLSPKSPKELLSPKSPKDPLSPKSPKEPLSPKSPLSPKEPLSPASATSRASRGAQQGHPVQFIYAQTVSRKRQNRFFLKGKLVVLVSNLNNVFPTRSA
jgi:hypothetical protein